MSNAPPPPRCPPGQANKLAVLLDACDGVVISAAERASLSRGLDRVASGEASRYVRLWWSVSPARMASRDEYPDASVECTITARGSDAHDYDRNAVIGYRDVPPGPIAEFVASVAQGIGERGARAMQAIAEDDEYGPIHLVRLVCAAEVAARTFGSPGLLAGETHGAQIGQFITWSVSPEGLPGLVAVLRSEELHAATDVAGALTVEERVGVLDALSHYVCRFYSEALSDPVFAFIAGGGAG